ncbi:MAG: phosphoglycerate kinase, partial [Crocinitomicaceae bacterium]|nr:phosphoglycerate kinase [Crocinitomicaceae bacterium]
MIDFKSYDFSGKKVLIRVDFNVPLDKETLEITDDKRIRAALPTMKHILEKGGSLIVMSHLGRPKEGPEDKFSLRHITKRIEELTGTKVLFANDCIGEQAVEMSRDLKAGEILVLENVRFYKEETKGDMDFAGKLAALGNCYVN